MTAVPRPPSLEKPRRLRVHSEKIARPPTLAILATFAGLVDFAFARVALRSLPSVPHDILVELSRWSPLPRNVAAVACIVALGLALGHAVVAARYAPALRRLSIASFSVLLLLIAALATVLTPAWTPRSVVLLSVGAANVLCVLLGLAALRYAGPRGLRVGLGLVVLSAFCAFSALVAALAIPALRLDLQFPLAETLWTIGERAFLLAPAAVAFSLVRPGPALRERVGLVVGVVVLVACVTGLLLVRAGARAEFPVLLYGATRLEMFFDEFPVVMLTLLALPLAVSIAALVGGGMERIQPALGLCLWCIAGYAPPSPGRLLYMTLGVALLTRASFAAGDHLIALRSSLPTPVPRYSFPSFPPET